MKIVDVSDKNKKTYLLCLQDYSNDLEKALKTKEKWYNEMVKKGLRVKMAETDTGEIAGMIQYFPIEQSWVTGSDLYFVSCIWVKSYKKGGGSYQNQGFGKALLKAAEEDVMQLGKKGMVVWGASLPVWMKASWYKKQGYEKVDKKGLFGDQLLWKTFTNDAIPPKWIQQKKQPLKSRDTVKITCCSSGWCTAMNMSCHTTKEVASEFGDMVEVEEIDMMDRQNFAEWGTSDTIFIDGKQINAGPPLSKERIRKIIEKKIRKKS